ncbi:flagellar hook-associated protein FlgL [Marichromatium bheemlicum]|uniref:Flagellar hook-associated protein FlgL n=1 Tax=Marichromatium bheemlicum TaxID=365339 RepID=A0ABX1I8A3_9GAMM|nr:flagellar hook-associated protein FlgL [Marichromatium bheemlicum]NKN33169.1 flagellar hook-associated protein FlgL [Marichromatium bheemlicum]
MRISTQQAFQSGVTAMQRAQSNLSHTQLQLATGRRILTPADDPAGATQAGQLNAAIRATEQYQRNADYARPRLEQEEANIIATENLLQRARELVLAGNNDTQNDQTRGYLASEIRQLRDDLIDIANTKDANDEYLFAGTRSFVQPFNKEADGSVGYVGAQGAGAVREVELSSTSTITVGDSGDVLFMDLPERSGQVLEARQRLGNTGSLVVEGTRTVDQENLALPSAELDPGNDPTSTLQVDSTEVDDQGRFNARVSEQFEIVFDDSSGPMQYSVLDEAGNFVRDQSGVEIKDRAYTSGDPIIFAGRRVTLSGTPMTGDKVISPPPEDFEADLSAQFEIKFSKKSNGDMVYTVSDDLGKPLLEDIPYSSGTPIEFAGRSVTLSGEPDDGDVVVSRPAKERDIFTTLDEIATALETPVSDPEVRDRLSESVEIALVNIDAGLDRFSEVRSTVGTRLQTLETQTELNAERGLNLERALSDIQDLDYAEAISRFRLQEVVLQAAQQTYVQVNRLSLFDFL